MSTTDWFDVEVSGAIVIRPEAKAIPEVQALLKDKQADKYWGYIWNVCSHRSPYAVYQEKERVQKVTEDFLKAPAPAALLKAVTRYRETLETPSMRLLRSSKAAALNIAKYLEDASNDPDAEVKEVVDTLGKIGKIIESLDKLEEKVKKEITNEERVRGGGEVRSRER